MGSAWWTMTQLSKVSLAAGGAWGGRVGGTKGENVGPEGEKGWVGRGGRWFEGEEPETCDGHNCGVACVVGLRDEETVWGGLYLWIDFAGRLLV